MRASLAFVSLASALPFLLAGTTASAHVDLVAPPPRLQGEAGGSQLKTKPCGQTTDKRTTDKITTFTPGQKVDIKIKEYVNHPGYFAVAFDPDGDDSFPFPRANMDKVVAATDDPKAMFPISDTVLGLRTDTEKDCYTEAADNSHECTIPITIPNVNCDNCTLQVTQFMYDKLGDNNDNEYYYQCADIKIQGAIGGSGGAGGSSSGGAAGSGTTGGTGSSSGGTGTAGNPSTAGNPGTAGTGTAGTPTATGGAPGSAGNSSVAGTNSTAAGASGTAATPVTGGGATQDSSGCGIAKRTQGGASALAALGLLFALGRRRRNR